MTKKYRFVSIEVDDSFGGEIFYPYFDDLTTTIEIELLKLVYNSKMYFDPEITSDSEALSLIKEQMIEVKNTELQKIKKEICLIEDIYIG